MVGDSVVRVSLTASIAALAAEIDRSLTELALGWRGVSASGSDPATLVDAAQVLAQIEGALLILDQHGLAALAQLVRDQVISAARVDESTIPLRAVLVQRLQTFLQRALTQSVRGKTFSTGELLDAWQQLLAVGLPTSLQPAVLISLELNPQAVARWSRPQYSPKSQTSQIPAAQATSDVPLPEAQEAPDVQEKQGALATPPADPDHLLLNLLRAQDDASQRTAAEQIAVLFADTSTRVQSIQACWYWKALQAYCVEYSSNGGDAARIKKTASAAVRLLRQRDSANLSTLAVVAREALFELRDRPARSEVVQAVVEVFNLQQQFDLPPGSFLVDLAAEDALTALARASKALMDAIESDSVPIDDPTSWSSLVNEFAAYPSLNDIALVLQRIVTVHLSQKIDATGQQGLAAGLCFLRERFDPANLLTAFQLIEQLLSGADAAYCLARLAQLWRAHHAHELLLALTAAMQADISQVAHVLDSEVNLDTGAVVQMASTALNRIAGALNLAGLSERYADVMLLDNAMRERVAEFSTEVSSEMFVQQWVALQNTLNQIPWQSTLSLPSSSNSVFVADQLDVIFIDEANALLHTMRDAVHTANWVDLAQAAHTLGGCSATVGLHGLAELALALESASVQPLINRAPFDLPLIEEVLASASTLLHEFAMHGTRGDNPSLVQRLQACTESLRAHHDTAAIVPTAFQVGAADADRDLQLVAEPAEIWPDLSTESESVQLSQGAEQLGRAEQGGQPEQSRLTEQSGPAEQTQRNQEGVQDAQTRHDVLADADELFEIFKLEAADLLPQLEQALIEWDRQPEDSSPATQLLRVLHTLKGSARMAGCDELGSAFHQAESTVSALRLQPPGSIAQQIPLLRQQVDAWMYSLTQTADAPNHPLASFGDDRTPSLSIYPSAVSGQDSGAELNTGDTESDTEQTLVESAAATTLAQQPTDRPAPALPINDKRSPMLRVRADRLAAFADTGAEIWTSNARLREGLQTQRRSLTDLADDLSRLRTQLRELEIEAESRVMARATQGAANEFDPLEFDRYTRLHELTRMMAESITDVVGVQRGLVAQLEQLHTAAAEQLRDLRRQQSELQALRSQPLQTIEARLRHVLQQAAHEVGCAAELVLQHGALEIERTLLDRLLGPLEHLLRNAVVHGLELPEQRRASGKPALGRVMIRATLTGNELQLVVQDDGRGLDLERIHLRACEAGLLAAGENIEARALSELIFAPGLSTATAVTALSGRGIGMDAVRADIHALGGQITVESETGRGCRFNLRVPVGLASLQVVLVRAGQWRIGLPAALVRQAMQVDVATIRVDGLQPQIMWQGAFIPVLNLAQRLGAAGASSASLLDRRVPVAVLSDGENTMALQLDLIEGQRELIVKPPGPQLAQVPGLAGVSVLADGAIALILQPFRLPDTQTSLQPPAPKQQQTLVLVVDDSLTVRRASQRLLERHGYAVGLARDGVEALELLQGARPALILLDIEMPRMDGFELLSTLRDDARWREIPVVMITSRIADRHRERAMQLGANAYLGKPYREEEVLSLLSSVTQRTEPAMAD